MPIAVVAGAAGFIGREVAHRLAARYRVVACGAGTDRPTIDAEALADVEEAALVVFAAGAASVAQSFIDPLRDFERSVPPLARVLAAVRRSSPAAKVIVLSSGAVYGRAATLPTPESAPPAPMSPYATHKVMAEQIATSWARHAGLSVAVVRLFSVYGPGLRRQLLWDACAKARRGERTFDGTGDEERDWLHVRDAAALIEAAAALSSPAAPVLNGGSGQATPVRTVVARIFAQLDAGEPDFTGIARAGDPPHMWADISAARALGWEPQVSLDAGIAEVVGAARGASR